MKSPKKSVFSLFENTHFLKRCFFQQLQVFADAERDWE